MSAREQATAVAAGRTTARELVDRALTRIEETDATLRAFVAVAAERARAEAADRDAAVAAGAPLGALHGVPVAVKDLFDVTGEVTTAGSLVPPGPAAARDATAVRRLRDAGAVVIGRTRTHEFAWGLTTRHGQLGGTHNPYDATRVTGGSSGGSAAAVAAGVVPLALGTDTAGSIRLPAAWCGVVGHKPTHGLVSADGVVPLAPSCDHVGAITADVGDARLALSVLTGTALDRRRSSPGGLRVGVATVSPVSAAVAAGVRRATDLLAGRGAEVREVELPDPTELLAVFLAVQAEEALAWHRATGRWPAYADRYGADVAARLRRAEALDRTAADRRPALRAAVATVLATVDVVLMPVVAAGPSPVADPDFVDIDGLRTDLRQAVLGCTLLASVCGLPACAVPVGLDDDGMPVGVQVVGPPGADADVLDVAELLAPLAAAVPRPVL